MWHDEVLKTNGDSIWGRITALITSLVRHKCTPRERADAYEHLLLSSSRYDDKQLASVPIESMINDALGKLAKIEDSNRTADKFRRKIGLLRRNGNENDEILRFLLLLADWDGILNSTPKSHFELPLRDTLNIPGYRRRYPRIDFSCDEKTPRRQQMVMFASSPPIHSICSEQTSLFSPSQIDVSDEGELFENENDDENEITEAMLFDERGNINGLAIDESLRSIWELSNQSSFQMISWKDTMKCLQSLMRGQDSELIKRATTSSPFVLRNLHSTLSFEFEGPSMLISLVSPFIDFANKMQSIERSLCIGINQCCSECSLSSERSTHHTRLFHLLSFHLKQCFIDIRNDLCEELNVNNEGETDCFGAKMCMNRTLFKCATYSKFFDTIIAIQQHSDYGCSEMIDTFFVVRTLSGSNNEVLRTLCDNILVLLIQHFHRSVLRWICKGDECFDDGVFRINNGVLGKINLKNINNNDASANIDDLVILWRNDFGIQLPSNCLFDKEWCNKWMCEGKMRKLLHLSLDDSNNDSVDNMNIDADAANYRLVIKEEEYDLKREIIIEALHSLTSIRAIISSKYRAVVNMEQAQRLSVDIMERFKETFSFIEDVFLGKNYLVLDTVISLLLQDDYGECGSPNKSILMTKNNNNNNLIRESDVIQQMYSALIQQKRWRRRFVKGLRINVCEENDDMFAMKLRYEPLFPLQIVFTTTSMDTFSEIWMLRSTLAIESAYLEKLEFDEILMSWHFMLMRSRMLSFVNALQMFLQTQIDHVLSMASLKDELLNSKTLDEAHEALKQLLSALRRCCLLGAKHVMLMNVFDTCIKSITAFRLAVKSIDRTAVESAFAEFDENVQLFCNVLKVQSANSQLCLSNLLVLIDLPGFYIDPQQS